MRARIIGLLPPEFVWLRAGTCAYALSPIECRVLPNQDFQTWPIPHKRVSVHVSPRTSASTMRRCAPRFGRQSRKSKKQSLRAIRVLLRRFTATQAVWLIALRTSELFIRIKRHVIKAVLQHKSRRWPEAKAAGPGGRPRTCSRFRDFERPAFSRPFLFRRRVEARSDGALECFNRIVSTFLA